MTTTDSDGWRRRLESRPLLADHPIALRITLALWVLGGALFIALAVPVLEAFVQGVDVVVHQLAVDLEFSPAVRMAVGLDFLGGTWVTVPVMILVGAYLAWRRRWEGVMYWGLSMLVSQILIGTTKAAYERSRPPLSLVETTGFSFPSGHAVAGAAIVIALVIVLVPAGLRRRNLEMLAAAFAVIMGLSRVYLRTHWLSDVVAGVALGAAVAVGVAVAMHYVVLWESDRSSGERSP
ncbi:MAG: phosphatase PAP2 family protein [Acidobacteria bacterium]|nr:phosphatase PAP2 family protein [Acidobacteriota bacterium]